MIQRLHSAHTGSDVAVVVHTYGVHERIANPILLHNAQASKALSAGMLDRTLATVAATGFDVWLHTPTTTGKFDFSTGLPEIFKHLQLLGYKQVVITSDDVPDLQAAHVLEASAKLQEGEAVLGPSRDGGAYLMGVRLAGSDLLNFSAVRWRTQHTLSDLLNYFESISLCALLLDERLVDVDRLTITKGKASLPLTSAWFSHFIAQLCLTAVRPRPRSHFRTPLATGHLFSGLRAPPLAA
ncbi:MAG TPA: DUF2064 domain-containing protein [Luteibaculaceae bacterium]|nr:DUF2064 domain-containing protein [Luteibaculaceae bacterium]